MLSIITGLGRSRKSPRVRRCAASRPCLAVRVRQGAAACATASRPSRCRPQARSCRPMGRQRFARQCSNRAGRPSRTARPSRSRQISERCRPVEARTLNGVATVQFLGNGQSGKATIKAISGGAASDALELSVGAAATRPRQRDREPGIGALVRRNDDDHRRWSSMRREIRSPACL